MANAQANASAGGSPAKHQRIDVMPVDTHGNKMGEYGPNWLKNVPQNSIRSKNMKRQDKAKKKKHNPGSHNPGY